MKFYLAKCSIFLLCGFVVMKSNFLEPYIEMICYWLAGSVYFLLNMFDPAVQIEGSTVFRDTYGYALIISKECSGLTYLLVVICAIGAFPTFWQNKLKAMIFAIFLVEGLNLVRIMILVYLKRFVSPSLFNTVHLQFMPFVLGICISLIFLYWAKTCWEDGESG